MENARTDCWIIEFGYGVDLFLESDTGKALIATFPEDVECKTFIMLLESSLPPAEHYDDEAAARFNHWKKKHQKDAWNTYIAGRFLRNDLFDMRAYEREFDELYCLATRSCTSVLNLMQQARRTPVIPAQNEDLQFCLPSERVTMQHDYDEDALERLKQHLLQEMEGKTEETDLTTPSNLDLNPSIPPPPPSLCSRQGHIKVTPLPPVQSLIVTKAPEYSPSDDEEAGTDEATGYGYILKRSNSS